ncbi:acyl-CoA/acyl-ACP dehydrogenase [Nonomuraea sp. SMC257]|uniref:Acyl-CoA/acyl-ACP dehydrogenase n=1 Tax=Nonomuraea montanisoli TaxID=2741721 RepID=A0A7Y6IA92_9ACTN|nr:acyl-CoA dehydrogenase family protein [Nonomuraea montanisoli]NUW34552.1 acyl-CoA/acyl-ACP dehydrogenase [Nonomuraea montanisoli]
MTDLLTSVPRKANGAAGTWLSALKEVVPVLARHAAEVDETAEFPAANLEVLRRSGLMGLLVPLQHGGMGGDLGDLIDVAQILASGCMSTAMIWAMHCQQVDALVRHASPELSAEVLPEIAAGRMYLASVTTEPGKGGHLLTARSAVEQDEELLRFSREAPIVTGGQAADAFLITMRSAADANAHSVSLLFARRRQLTLESRGSWNPLGMRGTHSVPMTLTGVVAGSQVVGRPGLFREVAVDSLIPAGHLGWAACWLGAARTALSEFVSLLRTPGRPRGVDLESDLVAERLARVRIDLELVAGYLACVRDEVRTARAENHSLDVPSTQIHLNALKVAASELTFRSVDRLVQLAGLSVGYLKSGPMPLERHFRDLRSGALNYSNDRLLPATGRLALMDRSVQLV